MTTTMMRWVLLGALFLTSAGCMGSPRSGQWFNNRDDTIEFSGLVPSPGAMINVEVYRRRLDDRPAGWDFVASTQADQQPVYTEPGGQKWYAWRVNTKLHFNTETKLAHWTLLGTAGYQARVRAFSWTHGHLQTFRKDLHQCLQGNSRLMCGGSAVQTAQEAVERCGTGDTEARIFAVD